MAGFRGHAVRVRWWRAAVPVAVLTAAIACDSSPVTPTPVAVPPTQVSVQAPSDLLKIGESIALTAVPAFTGGPSSGYTVAWTTDLPTVVSIDATGKATGLAAGIARVFASVQGVTGSTLLRVLPDVAGTWVGEYRFVRCQVDPPSSCSGPAGPSTLQLTLSQAGDRVTGRLQMAPEYGDVEGQLLMDGQLAFDAKLSAPCFRCPPGQADDAGHLLNWRSSVGADGRMQGTFTRVLQSWRSYWEFSGASRR